MTTPTYFTHGKVIAESYEIAVYDFEDELYLEKGPGHNLWVVSSEIVELKEQIGDKPQGNCLEIGLGLGIASNYILSKGIKSLTTIEINEDVIKVYKQLNPIINPRHLIMCQSGLNYLMSSDFIYDFIFLDFYSLIDEDTLPEIKIYTDLAKKRLNKGGEVMGWFDPYTPEEFVDEFFELFK